MKSNSQLSLETCIFCIRSKSIFEISIFSSKKLPHIPGKDDLLTIRVSTLFRYLFKLIVIDLRDVVCLYPSWLTLKKSNESVFQKKKILAPNLEKQSFYMREFYKLLPVIHVTFDKKMNICNIFCFRKKP